MAMLWQSAKLTIVSLFMVIPVTGCSSTGGEKPHMASPPDWLRGAVVRQDKVCAIGVSEPSYYIDDANEAAADNCRRQLAYTLSTQITSVMIDTATERRNTVEEASVSETTASISEMVVENAEVVEYWLDSSGQLSEKKNITYALCCMPKQ
jgi:hypothetical protein